MPDAIVDSYCAATRAQEKSLDGASMEVEMDGYIPKLKKHGKAPRIMEVDGRRIISPEAERDWRLERERDDARRQLRAGELDDEEKRRDDEDDEREHRR